MADDFRTELQDIADSAIEEDDRQELASLREQMRAAAADKLFSVTIKGVVVSKKRLRDEFESLDIDDDEEESPGCRTVVFKWQFK